MKTNHAHSSTLVPGMKNAAIKMQRPPLKRVTKKRLPSNMQEIDFYLEFSMNLEEERFLSTDEVLKLTSQQ